MQTINNINIKGIDYKVNGVKMVEVGWELDEGDLFFTSDKIDADYSKNIVAELYENDELIERWHIYFRIKISDYESKYWFIPMFALEDSNSGLLAFYDINYWENAENSIVYYSFNNSNASKLYGSFVAFEIGFGSRLSAENNYKLKVYYHEANETTQPTYVEY